MRMIGVLAFSALLAQEPAVIKVGTRLVQFNVIAHDKNGPVDDLKKEEFTILERGKPREIAVFHMDSRKTSEDKKPAPLPANAFSNRNSTEANSTILLFDSINTRFADQGFARLQIIKFIERLQPGDRIAIYSLGRDLRTVHEFSSDTASLLEAAKLLRVQLVEADAQASQAVVDRQLAASIAGPYSRALMGMMNNMVSDQRVTDVQNRMSSTQTALIAIARYFESIPGRKNLVWVSSAFPITIGREFDRGVTFWRDVDAASRALIQANVAVYPVDARGLMTNQNYGAATNTVTAGQAQHGAIVPGGPVGFAEQQTMLEIADRTGGKAYFANDIQGSIRRVLDDSEVTYTLGFYLSPDEVDSKFHEIKVAVDRKGVEVRTRKGFFALEDNEKPEVKRDIAMRQVLFAPLDATGLIVTVMVDRNATQANMIGLTSILEPKNLTFAQVDGKYSDAVDFVVCQQRADGSNVNVAAEVLNLAFTPERYKQVTGQAIQVRRSIQLEPETRMLRVMFYDRGSGLVGSARGPVAIGK